MRNSLIKSSCIPRSCDVVILSRTCPELSPRRQLSGGLNGSPAFDISLSQTRHARLIGADRKRSRLLRTSGPELWAKSRFRLPLAADVSWKEGCFRSCNEYVLSLMFLCLRGMSRIVKCYFWQWNERQASTSVRFNRNSLVGKGEGRFSVPLYACHTWICKPLKSMKKVDVLRISVMECFLKLITKHQNGFWKCFLPKRL